MINCSGQNVLDPLHRWNEDFKAKVYNSRVKTNEMLARAVSEAEAASTHARDPTSS